jgi:uncharacterized Zn finger protein
MARRSSRGWGYYYDPPVQHKREKRDPNWKPVEIEGRSIANTWWGKAWVDNLISYSDYSNRLPRGRSYVTSGRVVELRIQPGEVNAFVEGTQSTPYKIRIIIDRLSPAKWDAVTKLCGNSISNLEQLASGDFPEELKGLFQQSKEGLFPSPKEMKFSCSCPDSAVMCKHVAAALYGVGARIDENPTLFFMLRGVDFSRLLQKSVDAKLQSMLKNANQTTPRVIQDADIKAIFKI